MIPCRLPHLPAHVGISRQARDTGSQGHGVSFGHEDPGLGDNYLAHSSHVCRDERPASGSHLNQGDRRPFVVGREHADIGAGDYLRMRGSSKVQTLSSSGGDSAMGKIGLRGVEFLTECAPSSNGILRFVHDEDYAESFGAEWTWFPTTQLTGESRNVFFAKTGWSPGDLDGKTVLDAGCGMGRFAAVATECGARVVAVDLTRAVDAAARNLAGRETVLLQADLMHLPIRPASFDLIYSIGVLHHTPNTRVAFERLVPLLKPGGQIAIWVYSGERRDRLSHLASDLYRRYTTRMEPERILRLARRIESLGRLYRTRFGRYLYPLLPVSTHQRRDWRVLDTFDWYSPTFQHKHRWSEVESWFHEAGLTGVRRNAVAVAVSGTRSAPAVT